MEYILGDGNLESIKMMKVEQIFQYPYHLQNTVMSHCLENVQIEAYATILQVANHRITKVGKDVQDHPVQLSSYHQHLPLQHLNIS